MTQQNPGSSDATRRDFMKTSAVLSTAAIAANLGIARSAHAAGSDEIKIGLVGCGGRGTGAAGQALSTEGKTKIVAMADAFDDRLNGAAKELKKFGDKFSVDDGSKYVGFDAYKKLIDRDDISVVVLATPPGFRPIHFEYAVSKGKHVFMEKPVAVDAAGVQQVLAAAKLADEKKLKVGVGLQRHHQKNYIETIDKIREGYIGKVIALRAYWNNAGVWVRPRQPGQSEMDYQMRNWYYFNWLCGDHITEQHIHNLDVANWVMNSHPVVAHGMGGREVRVGKEYGEIFDHHCVEYTYADGTKLFSQCRHIPGCRSDVSEWVHGEKGEGNLSGVLQLYGTKDAKGEVFRAKGGKDAYQVEHDDLFDAIRNDKPYNEAYYGATSSMTSVLGRMATYSGKEIKWDDAMKAPSIMPKKFTFDAEPPVLPDKDGFYPKPIPGKTNVI